tara:strand:+ start:507 stop:2525 length:2019 start_codon:yes stop_codon:yes gene_type:complete
MKVLYSRITRAIKAKPKIESLCDDLTLIGIEVDEIKSFQGDKIIDFDLTPNRGDCFSVKGLARDYCAFKNKKFSSETKTSFKRDIKFSKKIKLLAREGCSAYSAVSVSNLKLKKKFPDYIKKTLKAAGIQSIHPLVDIVNFVMLESGQPMHVFDQDKIEGDIEVRFAKTKEKIKILGEKNLRLTKDCLVISDEKEPIAFAGISGGLSHSVSKKTQNFLIESAFFDPSIIKGKARRYGFQTDASQRFERGVDFNLHEDALKEALSIIQEIYQADISNIETTKNKYFPRKKLINIATEDVNLKLGTNLKENTIKSILKRLEIKLVKKNQKNLVFEVPSHRFDLSIKEDLVEEIARIVGYDNLPQIKNDPMAQHYEKSDYDFTYEIKTFMANKGFNEVINYSFLDRQALENLGIENKSISLKNPLNNSLSTLRTSLLPSLASNLEFNINRGQNFLNIFEIGKSFSDVSLMEEIILAGLIYDDEKFKNWNTNLSYDFYYMKGILENLFEEFRLEKISWKKSQNDLLHPYASADIYLKNKLIGSVGSINPRFLKLLGLNKAFFYFEIKIESLPRNDLRKLIAPSIYPISQRDFSFEIDNKVSFEQIEYCIQISTKDFLIGLQIFDVYDGKNIPDGKKSIAFRVSWGSSKKTLSEEEINKEANLIISGMQKKLGAILR